MTENRHVQDAGPAAPPSYRAARAVLFAVVLVVVVAVCSLCAWGAAQDSSRAAGGGAGQPGSARDRGGPFLAR